MHAYRSHSCNNLRPSDVGDTVRLSGWVHRVRDHGGLLFIDLRDHYGLTQCVADPDSPAFAAAETVRAEWVIRIDGKVKERSKDTINTRLATGAVEVFIQELEVLSEAGELPLPVFGEPDYPEETRLTYRFLDLRRDTLHANIVKRSEIIASLRRRMLEESFTEFQTPILTASSPEGARDFLVPSRMHPGKFYALPQAPQQFKQLIMIAGFDRYFQIAPCFRDEDARADRSPGEFYQLDIEMSFVTQEDVFGAVEPVLTGLFEEFANGRTVTSPFPRIPYAEAMQRYGSDKPDLRNPIEMEDVTAHFAGSGFKVFAGMIAKDDKVRVWAIPAPGGGNRAFCDRMNSWAQGEGQPGLGYIFWRETNSDYSEAAKLGKVYTQLLDIAITRIAEDRSSAEVENLIDVIDKLDLELSFVQGATDLTIIEIQNNKDEIADAISRGDFATADRLMGLHSVQMEAAGPIAKNIGPDRTEAIRGQLDLAAGDAVFFVAGQPKSFAEFAGRARTRIGEELELIDQDRFEFCWIVDFPMFEWNEEEKRVDFSHNPFSMPQGGLEALEAEDPLDIKAFQYDIVCNGVELSSGAIRNHQPEIMRKAFAIAGYDQDVLEQEFGGMLRALQCGAPPHGGIAPGIDRIVMLLCGTENIREVIMFPMNQQAEDLLMGAPSEVSAHQLRELHIRLNLPKTS